jgi:hypothetical protein
MSTRSQLACLLAILVAILALNARAQDEEATPPRPSVKKSAKSEPLLPQTVMLPLKAVKEAFPDVTRQLSTGPDSGALDQPKLTRAVVYASHDGAKQVTLSVDQYEYESQAVLAYQQAEQKSQLAEFESIAISNIGQQVFAGAIKRGSETQIVITTLNGTLLVGVRLAGYEDTTDNISKLAELARLQEAESHTRVSVSRKR